MGEARELALHPGELAGVLDRLLVGVGDMDAGEVAAVLGPRSVADLLGGLVVEFPDLLGLLDRGVQRDVGIALLAPPR